MPRNPRELAENVFAERDPVIVGRDLLSSESEAVRARVWEKLVNYAFAKPAQGKKSGPSVRFIWDLPGPPRESQE